MKPFAKRILAFTSAAAITLTTIPAVHADHSQEPVAPTEQWDAVEASNTEVLIPARARSTPGSEPVTREAVCDLVMSSYETITGHFGNERSQSEKVFTDTEDQEILSACELGLIRGRRAGVFDPEGTITRQDFWTMAAELLESVGYPYIDDIEIDLSAYADGDEVLAYARQPVQALLALELIDTAKGEALDPTGALTTEEAALLLDRLRIFFGDWIEDPVEPPRYLGEEIAEFAQNFVGCRYVYGAKGPSRFDCSGLVYYVFKQYGYKLNPGARNQWDTMDQKISKKNLLPGDIVFFSRSGKASGIFHVGIYIGDSEFVHAANSRKGVIISSLNETWYANRYYGAKRAID